MRTQAADVALVERTEGMVVFYFREDGHEAGFRVLQGQAPVSDLAPGRYRVRRFLTTHPLADLGEVFLEVAVR